MDVYSEVQKEIDDLKEVLAPYVDKKAVPGSIYEALFSKLSWKVQIAIQRAVEPSND